MVKAFDIVIIGGGAVGLSLALKLGKTAQSNILLVEARDFEKSGSIVDRSMALSFSSQKFYKELGLWSALAPEASPIETVHISMQHHYGTTRIHAADYQVPALGYVLPLSHIENTLIQAVSECPNITLWSNTRLLEVKDPRQPKLTLSKGGEQIEVDAELLVGTDGVNSQVAKSAKIGYQKTTYGHMAIICHVNTSLHHNGIAYERFTQDGALAFLPFGQKRATFVWTVSESNAERLLNLSEEAYLAEALQAFGYRLGHFVSCTRRVTHPLVQLIAEHQWLEKTVLLGNSAHTLHPIAAQGLNLSLRDIAVFTKIVQRGLNVPLLGKQYLDAVASDQKKVMWVTNQIAKQVSSPKFPGWLKATLMIGLDGFNPIKRPFSRLTMGLSA